MLNENEWIINDDEILRLFSFLNREINIVTDLLLIVFFFIQRKRSFHFSRRSISRPSNLDEKKLTPPR